jgi:hypothetical protein
MSGYLDSNQVKLLMDIVGKYRIRPRILLTACNPQFVAQLSFTDCDADDLITDIYALSSTDRLNDESVPLMDWLGLLICKLNGLMSPYMRDVIVVARDVYRDMPEASRRHHKAAGVQLFPEVASEKVPSPSGGAQTSCEDSRPPSTQHGDACTKALAPASGPDAIYPVAPAPSTDPRSKQVNASLDVRALDFEPETVRSRCSVSASPPISGPAPVSTRVPPVADEVPLHAPTLFTLATAGAAGGGATMIQMVYLPVVRPVGMTEAHCFLMVIAAIPVGALGAVVLWSIAEEFARARAGQHGRMIGYLLISLGALIGGGGMSLLAHALADMAFKPGPSPEWLSLGLSGAAGSLCAAWSRSMARPTTVWKAIWTAGAAVLGTYVGYFIYLPIVGLIGGLGYDTTPLLALLRQSSVVALGAFIFVAVTQIMMSLQLHGADAFGLRSGVLRARPRVNLVPRSIFPATVLGALVAAVAVLGHSCSFAMQAQLP